MDITQPDALISSASEDKIICKGSETILSMNVSGGTPPYTYHWSMGNTTASVPVSPVSLTTYTCYATDNNNCIGSTESITISILPSVDLSAVCYQSICPGDSAAVFFSASSGVAPYTLYTANGTIINTVYYAHSTHTETLYFYVRDNCDVVDSASVVVNVYPSPTVNITADRYQGCSPLSVHFLETSLNTGQSYLWNFDDDDENNLSLAQNPVHVFDVAGSYDISLQVTNIYGCKIDTTLNDFITVFPIPESRFVYYPIAPTILNPEIEFVNYSQNNIVNLWSFGDGDSSLMENPDHIYREIGDYSVSLVVISDKGCRDTSIQILKIQDYFTLYAPNAFSPDGDGRNDIFYVFGSGILEGSFKLFIYDRWGEVIHQLSDIMQGWDGTIKGQIVQNGTYVWMVVCKNFEGNQKIANGVVTLIR